MNDTGTLSETPLQLALKVLKAINKSVKSAVQIETIPPELCIGETVNLAKWSMVTTDENLLVMAKQPDVHYFVDASKPFVRQMFHRFWEPTELPHKLRTLNLTKSVNVSDYALTCVLRGNPGLTDLNISGCTSITDASLRELGLNCVTLQALNISSCDGVEGQGLIAVAECCKQLRKVDFSANTTLQRFAISKIFYECHRIEEVYVNNLLQVGDDEIRALAQNSRGITTFIARDSQFISDQSLLALSQYCPDVDTIDISREKGQFRITDVGLLALGERSKALRVLNVNGCDQVSDVGIQWLASGCRALEELNMNGCPRITDAGMRFIGENCRALEKIDVTGAQYASDVGITSLCTGCPNLKILRFKGVWLLSDPRLSAPTKGSKLEAWQSVVGLPALVQSCEKLEEVDFTGCFRLNIAVRKYLSTLSNLKIATLSGCNQMESRALQGLARGCKLLVEINLNDCGNCVDADAMKAFAENCHDLQRVAINRNPKITAQAVKWISRIKSLERLEMSNCRGLDDMALLPLTEADKCPHLSLLSVTKNDLVTDTALAWVANGCASQLLTFSFKGTSITKASARAVRDMFAYCDMIFDENMSGFFPKPRVGHRKLLNHYYVMQQGFARIQARVRRWGATRRVARVRSAAKREASAQLIINTVRIVAAQHVVHRKRMAWKKLNRDAEIVTSFFWICFAKKRVWRVKQHNYHMWIRSQVECIQRAWRLFWKKTRWYLLKKEFLEWVRLNVFSATKIESTVRMYQGKTRARRVYEMRLGRKHVEERKARFIQRFYRGYKGRIRAWIIKAQLEDRLFQENRGSTRIQHTIRKYRLQKLLDERILEKRMIAGAVVMMQSIVRGRISRVRVMEIKADIREIKEEAGALKVQTRWRVKKARLRVQKIREAYYRRIAKQGKAASVIANAHRGRVARRALADKLAAKTASVHLKVQARIWAATTIQSYYRGHCGRVRFNGLVREKKGKWKELYDSEKQRRFFYNKLTGEIRWRMPQDLLDLIPRPQCDNCEFYEAALECVVCNEVYCMQCFDQVHYGGRRKDHEFRSLFDFYGKRLDYGDGVFPSKWPSEVIQDEVQGWMLRVAPIRDPRECWGDWEIYSDADARAIVAETSKSSPGHKPPPAVERTFYFNRATFEASYDEPPDVQLLRKEEQDRLEREEQNRQWDSQRIAEMDQYVHAPGNRPNTGTYYDSEGNVVTWDPSSQGYYDEHGQWITSDENFQNQGYYDASGQWVATEGQSYEEGEWEGYYDERGNYIYTDPNVNGYWSHDGTWVEYAPSDAHPEPSARESARASARGPKPPLSARLAATARGSARGGVRGSAHGPGGAAMATTGSMLGGKKSGRGEEVRGWIPGVAL